MDNKISDDSIVPVWGGIECTINRINDRYSNQLERNGHVERISDLDLIAELGIKTMRYPVVWEAIAPDGLARADWSWIDERLTRMRELGITPIASLLHHGSGPRNTSLIDPLFPEKFTEFAIAVAERYPWMEFFTPVNEPLTTARFSCLYGHWYPHTKHSHSFAQALLNQCKATVMAMREIKKRIPSSKLVQTEDLGKCHGSEPLRYQWELENERRWSSLDLLTGRHENNSFIMECLAPLPGIKEQLDFFRDNHFSPDIVGINYYITSERYLDHQYSRYPEWSYGTNGKDFYADVEIVRADIQKRAGHYTLLKEASDRYGLPVAFTEVHLGATRDEQMRWFMEAWSAVTKLKKEGVDVRGITAWSMFGAYDWNTLLTKQNNHYETGVFDVSSGKPRPTALAGLIRSLSNGQTPEHEVLASNGWWKNPGTVDLMFGTKQEGRHLTAVEDVSGGLPAPTPRQVLITGGTGTLGKAFAKICQIRNISYVLLTRQDMDIADFESVNRVIGHYKPWAVINAAGYVRVDEAETNPSLCLRENTDGAARLAAASARFGAAYLTFSSDLVFDGLTKAPYVETDQAKPLNIYGISKFLAESRVLNVYPSALVIRTSSFFGPWDEHNFLAHMIKSVSDGKLFGASSDFIMSPTYVPDLVNACLDLIIDGESGTWHITNPSATSWTDFALMTAEIARLNTGLIRGVQPGELGYRAPRPVYSALKSQRGILMPNLESAIKRFLADRAAQHQRA